MAQEPDDLSAEPAHDSFLRRLALPVAPAEPTLRLGTKVKDRYVVTRPIGSGGMGEVYLARDVSLERDVALKRHRHGRDVERLRREALAMARLAHPNVVTVYEVGELEAGTFVAMEYVPGTTLRGYLAESARSFRQIEEMLRMAGLGLAAAHDAGIVHRDFKPENVLVGRDGRARVSDFGLASQRDDELEYASTIRPGALGEAGAATALGSAATVPGTGVAAPLPLPLELTTTAVAPAAGSPRAPLGLTAPGTVMGTPAYMAPEQASGEVVDARADQYAFCVVAWEALFGERPDARAAGSPEQGGAKERIGARAGERAGERVAPGAPLGSARRWRRVLARGLSVRPADRFADMHALLEEARARRPWAALAGAVGLLAAASAATWWLLATPPLRCEDAGAELDDAGPLARWRALELDDAVSGVDREVLRLRRDYRSAAQTVCRARAQGAWSKELAARGQGCLALQRQLAAGLLGEASPSSPGGVDQAAELALRALPLPAPLSCADPTRLWALPALPQESAAARTAVRARVAVLIAERSKQPLDEAQLSAAIRGHAYVASRLGLLRAAGVAAGGGRAGPLPAGAARVSASLRPLEDAREAALSAGDSETALLASAALVQRASEQLRDPDAARRALAQALDDAARLGAGAPEAAAMVYLAGARAEEVLSMSRASSSEASTRVEEVSLALVAKAMSLLPETPTSATRIAALEQRAALQLAMGRRGDARADVAALLQLARGLMGDDHPRVARLAANAALMWSRAWQPDAALPHLREAERVLARHAASPIAPPELPMLGLELAAIRRALGLAHLEAGERALGVPLLTAARAASASAGDSSSLESATALALAHLDAHRPADARAVLQAELAAQLTSLPPDHAELAVVHYNLAVALRELGQLAPAADHAARAVALYQAAGQADLHRLAVALASQIAVRRGQPELALQWTAEVLHSPSASDPLALAWPRLERARALIALERDLPEARRLLLEALQISQIGGNAGARRAEIEQLLHALPAPKGGK